MNDLERFLRDLEANPELREEFAALDSDPEVWVLWANGKGYAFSRQEAGRLAEIHDGDISDDDLEKVAGGWCGNEITTG